MEALRCHAEKPEFREEPKKGALEGAPEDARTS